MTFKNGFSKKGCRDAFSHGKRVCLRLRSVVFVVGFIPDAVISYDQKSNCAGVLIFFLQGFRKCGFIIIGMSWPGLRFPGFNPAVVEIDMIINMCCDITL